MTLTRSLQWTQNFLRPQHNLLRGARFPAVLLLVAAGLGLLAANTPVHDPFASVLGAHIAVPATAIDLSVAHWISDGLLAIFSFVVAMELVYELTTGELNSIRRALQPTIAAAGGVTVPIVVYLLIASGEQTAHGWPIPTATDIAFALGVLAVFGKGLPSAVRIFLLALAILDDIVGIVFIAVLFAQDLDGIMLGLGVLGAIVFGALSRMLGDRRRPFVVVVMCVVGVATWGFIASSGVHATIAGVLLGLAMAQTPAMRARHLLDPWVNGLILPLFAFTAAFVVIPQVSPTDLSPAFWAVTLALPVGKLIGISGFGWIAMRLRPRGAPPAIVFPDLLAAGALGGIGFTVSLLLANLAFAEDDATRDQAILGVLSGSLVALILCAALVSARAAHYRRAAARR